MSKPSNTDILAKKVKRKKKHWSVFFVDCETAEIYCVWTGLTKREAFLRWRLCDEREINGVLVMWPEWMPALKMELLGRIRTRGSEETEGRAAELEPIG